MWIAYQKGGQAGENMNENIVHETFELDYQDPRKST